MSDMNATMPKCGYCGSCHSYSTEMCRDLTTRTGGGFVTITTVTKTEQEIRADERRRLREKAMQFLGEHVLDDIFGPEAKEVYRV
ncbi:MAG: hypothetical protein IMZ71_00355 [Chloroflexi bacterium]|nr:hypothetical protein [Chloroflexota bacterium]